MAPTDHEVVVLVVEDHDAARDTLAEFLTVCGFQVHTAPDGREGVELAQRIHPDVIVMDLAMPVMDGWEATRRLKANHATRNIPVLVLTAYGHDLAHRLAQEMGCSEVLVKPVDPRFLQQRVAFHGTHPLPDAAN